MLAKKQFVIKYLWRFNFYGNLLFLGLVLCAAAAFGAGRFAFLQWRAGEILWCVLPAVLAAAFVTGAGVCLYSGLEISGQLETKYKFYRVITKRIRRNGFKDEYFEDVFDSPCYRLIARQILRDCNREKDYYRLKHKWQNYVHYTDSEGIR
jgi:hypothetical protein